MVASLTQWVWVDSGSWWWTGRPGMLQFKGSQRVGHDWRIWSDPSCVTLWSKTHAWAYLSPFWTKEMRSKYNEKRVAKRNFLEIYKTAAYVLVLILSCAIFILVGNVLLFWRKGEWIWGQAISKLCNTQCQRQVLLIKELSRMLEHSYSRLSEAWVGRSLHAF